MSIVEDQSAVRAFLADPETHGGAPVEIIETHISVIFLAGARAWKLKRAVRLPYADLATPERRLAICETELARNRLTAPDHYLAVRRITREGQGLAFDGAGPLVDAVVEMRRFGQEMLFDALARRGALDAGLMEALAAEIAALHMQVPQVAGGGAENIARVLAVNEAAFATGAGLEPGRVGRLCTAFRAGLAHLAPLLDARAEAGRLRLCHGDLHLRNIFLDAGRPVLFDCLEFNDDLASVDVLYDLAFLLMDLRHRGLGGFANLVMNRYLDATGDEDGLPALGFFMALRAAVRAHVGATAAAEPGAPPGAAEAARAYLGLAEALLAGAPPVLVALGGLSGTGKSTVAARLAPRLGAAAGARLLASDRLRKARFGVPPETRLPQAAYAPEVSVQVYGDLTGRSVAVARAGTAAIADAVFARPEERAALAAAAAGAGVRFLGVWLEAPAEVLRARVAARQGGVSDAGREVLERQLGYDLGQVDWLRLDARRPAAETAAAIEARLAAVTPEAAPCG